MVLDGCPTGDKVASLLSLSQAIEFSISPKAKNGINRIANFFITASFSMVCSLRISTRVARFGRKLVPSLACYAVFVNIAQCFRKYPTVRNEIWTRDGQVSNRAAAGETP